MLDIFAKLLGSVASLLFPIFASYKALKTTEPAQLTPWLIYWVVLACGLLIESWLEWFLAWIPFYAYMRLLILLYLVFPQTQGARIIYQERIHPLLEANESSIEEFVASSHNRLKAAGISYLKCAIQLVKMSALGMAPSSETPPTEQRPPQTSQSFTQSLLARSSVPSAPYTPSSTTATDLYSLCAYIFSAARVAQQVRPKPAEAKDLPVPPPNKATIVPGSIRGIAARLCFTSAQSERLASALSALDREAVQAQQQQEQQQQQDATVQGSPAALQREGRVGSFMADGGGSEDVSTSSGQPTPTLSKSRSEGDFEKLEAESGAEEDMLGPSRTFAVTSSAGGGWMPWRWGLGTSSSLGGEDAKTK